MSNLNNLAFMECEWASFDGLLDPASAIAQAHDINCNKQKLSLSAGHRHHRNKEDKEKVLSHTNFLDSKFVNEKL